MKILTTKQVNNAINRIAANQLIAEDALKRAHMAGVLSLKEFDDSFSHLTDNSIELASIIGGVKGISKLNDKMEYLRCHYRRKEYAMTTIEKLNAIPKVVLVSHEQAGDFEPELDYDDDGLAQFKLDLNIYDEGVLLAYYQHNNDETYELWCVSASTYDNDGEEPMHPTIGECLEYCLDETIKHFKEAQGDYSFIDTYSGYSYDNNCIKLD